MFFESHDAFVHIEIKTSEIDNRGDYYGLTPISRKQTSYPLWRIDKPPGLPIYYRKGKSDEKPCLTFAIHIIHDPETLDIIAILLLSIPNGQLHELYGDGIVGGGKVKGESFRYRYKDAPFFKSLPNKPHRVRIVYFDEKSGQSKKDITALELED